MTRKTFRELPAEQITARTGTNTRDEYKIKKKTLMMLIIDTYQAATMTENV